MSMKTGNLRVHPGWSFSLSFDKLIENTAFAYLLESGALCLKLKEPIDGSDVVQLKFDNPNGFWHESVGTFNEFEGRRISDSGAEVREFLHGYQMLKTL